MLENKRISIFKKASFVRCFEEEVFKNVKKSIIKIPVYLSAGQEYIAATISEIVKDLNKKPLLFPQHRCHSTFLCHGGNPQSLIKELLGRKDGCTEGRGGSASIHSKKINMFGHDGHMGTQLPIGVGACFASKKPTIVFLGDASAEEDYVLGALGWASTKKLPIVIVIEDNNLSILTKKKVRRNWDMHEVGKAFKIESYDIDDNPRNIYSLKNKFFKKPLLLNINTTRIFWHAGAGQDDLNAFDRLKKEENILGKRAKHIHKFNQNEVFKLWEKILKKQ